MAKNNIRSIRFTDELAKLIDRQVGNTFTEKFENLVTRCVWELPQKEKELEEIERGIKAKKQELAELSERSIKVLNTISKIELKLYELDKAIFSSSKEWDV